MRGLGVEFEGQAEGDVEVGRLVLVGLREGEAVGVVPKVVAEGKPLLTAAASDSVVASGVNIGKNIREAAKLIQGGGQPHFATAGGKDVNGIHAAVEKLVELLVN